MLSRYLIGTCAIFFLALVNVSALTKDRLHYHSAVRTACGNEINSPWEKVAALRESDLHEADE